MSNQVNGLFSNWLRKQRIKSALPHIGKNILDFGCGTGKFSEFIQNRKYVGIDVDKQSIKEAKHNYPGITFMEIKNFKYNQNNKFDTIIMLAVLEHLKNPRKNLEKLSEILDKNGKIVMTTPHPRAKWIHKIGSEIGLFSKEANEEHEELIGKNVLEKIIDKTELKLSTHKVFLGGLNQLFILTKK